MNRQRPMRPPQTKESGILANTEVTIFLLVRKKKADHKRSPSSTPITNPLREKAWGREGDGTQVRYGQRIARAAQVTPIVSAARTSSAACTSFPANKAVKKKRSPSVSPIALCLRETMPGFA